MRILQHCGVNPVASIVRCTFQPLLNRSLYPEHVSIFSCSCQLDVPYPLRSECVYIRIHNITWRRRSSARLRRDERNVKISTKMYTQSPTEINNYGERASVLNCRKFSVSKGGFGVSEIWVSRSLRPSRDGTGNLSRFYCGIAIRFRAKV